jgi:hypothetical protein
VYQQIYDEARQQGSDHWEANFIAVTAIICGACEKK